jgi:hypothetical protein
MLKFKFSDGAEKDGNFSSMSIDGEQCRWQTIPKEVWLLSVDHLSTRHAIQKGRRC